MADDSDVDVRECSSNDELMDVSSSLDSDFDPELEDIDGEDSSEELIPAKTRYSAQEKTVRNTVVMPSTSQVENLAKLRERESNVQFEGETISDNNQGEGNGPVIEESESQPQVGKRNTRKRLRRPQTWKANCRKKLCQEFKEYTSRRGKLVPERVVKTTKDCRTSCKFQCMNKIASEERKNLFECFRYQSQDQKFSFYGKTTERHDAKRKTKKNTSSRRQYSFSYFFYLGNDKIRVCKEFYLGTLSISQKRIYNFHGKKKDPLTGMLTADLRGKHVKKCISEEQRVRVRNHIKSFPAIESHYCRATSKKVYLESELSIKKMYELYQEQCVKNAVTPVEESFYRYIFTTEFNIAFHQPSKDRCDHCEEYKVANQNNMLNDELSEKYELHIQHKNAARAERKKDRDDNTKLVVCIDLENVVTLPKCGIKNFFYRRKLNLYNMTAHVSTTKQGYCAIWTELMSGRSGNDIASATMKILEQVIKDNPAKTEMILWFDSCVPQNRNSLMSYAISMLIAKFPHMKQIEVKFCTPGHSMIQEVDNIHSLIERAMRVAEFYSPVSFLRLLVKANRHQPFKVIQLKPYDFRDFQTCSKTLQYVQVPFTKVLQLRFSRTQVEVEFTTEPGQIYTKINLRDLNRATRSPDQSAPSYFVEAKQARALQNLPEAKANDIRAMKSWMPKQDQDYYDTILPKKVVKKATKDPPAQKVQATRRPAMRRTVRGSQPTAKNSSQRKSK